MSDPVRYDIVFTGRVQGVFFRATARDLARGRPVAGWIRNEPDGTVRAVVEGVPEELDHFVEAVQAAKRGHIDETRLETSPATGEFRGFEIRH